MKSHTINLSVTIKECVYENGRYSQLARDALYMELFRRVKRALDDDYLITEKYNEIMSRNNKED